MPVITLLRAKNCLMSWLCFALNGELKMLRGRLDRLALRASLFSTWRRERDDFILGMYVSFYITQNEREEGDISPFLGLEGLIVQTKCLMLR